MNSTSSKTPMQVKYYLFIANFPPKQPKCHSHVFVYVCMFTVHVFLEHVEKNGPKNRLSDHFKPPEKLFAQKIIPTRKSSFGLYGRKIK